MLSVRWKLRWRKSLSLRRWSSRCRARTPKRDRRRCQPAQRCARDRCLGSPPATGPAVGGSGFRRRVVSSGRTREAALTRCGKRETGTDTCARWIREVFQNLLFRHASGKILKHIIDGDSSSLNARLPVPHPRGDGNLSAPCHRISLCLEPTGGKAHGQAPRQAVRGCPQPPSGQANTTPTGTVP